LLTPVFSAALTYNLSPYTSLSLGASRSFSPSYFANQYEVITSVSASIQQQLSKKLSLAFNAGYGTEPLTSLEPAPLPRYFVGTPPTTALAVDEKNTSTSYGVSLSYAVLTRVNLTTFYSVGENASTQANFKYSSTQIGFSLTYAY
jgi:hypothetical protein